MALLTDRLPHSIPRGSKGFTLTELSVAAAMGVLVAIVAGDAMVSHLRSSARAESLQRQRDDWYRATSFIESEIAMSERVISSASNVSIPSACGLTASEFRMALDIRRDLPQIIYGVKATKSMSSNEQRQWIPDQVLIRCGPEIGDGSSDNQDYLANLRRSVLLDGLDGSAPGAGFLVNTSSSTAKSAVFNLAIKGLSSSRFAFGAGTYSRINPVAAFPETLSSCDKACDANGNCSDINGIFFLKGRFKQQDTLSIPVQSITDNDNTVICGLGGGDRIFGTQGNDVIDAGSYAITPGTSAGATIDGGSRGRNFLFGTPGDDVITGGDGDDTLVGRGGGDTMLGGGGNNAYLPWLESASVNRNAQIQGGTGLDVVYLRGNRADFSGTDQCSASGCTISQGNITLTMSNVDVLIFKDGRVDLR